MKTSEILYERTVPLWDKATKNPFVTAMAQGSLKKQQFKDYMLQDYYYLTEYIEILAEMQEQTENAIVSRFLDAEIKAARDERDLFHVPNMKSLGITDSKIKAGLMARDSRAYLDYMKKTAREGTVRGLTALLQCSWSYAYISQAVVQRYGNRLDNSPYASWFYAYTSEEYTIANQRWIDILDSQTADISEDEVERLCMIFERCAQYENSFWDIFTL